MPRDILTTVLQNTSAERLLRLERERFQQIIRAVLYDYPVPLHHEWRKRTLCCVCASPHVQNTLKYIDSDGRFGTQKEISICGTCFTFLKFSTRERLFTALPHYEFVVWI